MLVVSLLGSATRKLLLCMNFAHTNWCYLIWYNCKSLLLVLQVIVMCAIAQTGQTASQMHMCIASQDIEVTCYGGQNVQLLAKVLS